MVFVSHIHYQYPLTTKFSLVATFCYPCMTSQTKIGPQIFMTRYMTRNLQHDLVGRTRCKQQRTELVLLVQLVVESTRLLVQVAEAA